MKKIFVFAMAAALLVSANVTKAQEKLKEGKATFEISYPDAEEMNDQMLAMMPKESVTYFNGGNTRTELTAGYGTTIILYDNEKKEMYYCMDMMGKKSAVKSTEADMEKEKAEAGEYDVKLSDETKKIAGYTCKKATVTMKKDANTFDVWYTPDLPHDQNGRNAWKGIDGFPMEFTIDRKTQGGSIKMKLTCTKIEKISVPDDKFKVPDGFTVMTQDEMKKQWGGGK
jgi:GLPGLI family protein